MTSVQFDAWAEDLRSKYGIAAPFAPPDAADLYE